MKRTLTALLLCTALCAVVFAQNASDFKTDGKGTITGYTGKAVDVVIPSQIGGVTITAIGYRAFENKKLTSVAIPNGITSIGGNAFSRNGLTSVTIPTSVTSVGSDAFVDNELISVTIGANVKVFGSSSIISTGDGGYIRRGIFTSFDESFDKAYFSGGMKAGTYTRPNTDSETWTRNDISAQVLSKSTSGNLGETLKLSGKLREFNGNHDFKALGVNGKIVNGQINYVIGKPTDDQLKDIDDAFIRIFWGIGGIKYSDPTVRAAHLYLYMGNGASIYRATPGFGTSVDYYYVERDLTISRDSAKGVNAFNLSLKKGWNAIITVRENDSTTYSLGNREDLFWEISQDK